MKPITISTIKVRRLSNGDIIELNTPLYMNIDGINGYLFISNNRVYWSYSIDGVMMCPDVTQYFELL